MMGTQTTMQYVCGYVTTVPTCRPRYWLCARSKPPFATLPSLQIGCQLLQTDLDHCKIATQPDTTAQLRT